MITDLTKLILPFQRLATSLSKTDAKQEAQGIKVGCTQQGKPVFWPSLSSEKASHICVLAASGGGKSVLTAFATLLERLMFKSLPSSEQPSYIIIDPKGDLVSLLLAGSCAIFPDEISNLVYLHPFQQNGFAFNLTKLKRKNTPLDIVASQLAQLCAAVSTARGSQAHLGVGARQIDSLEHMILATIASEHPQANVLWALDALRETKGLKQLATLTSSERARQFLLSSPFSEELRVSTLSRLRSCFAATEQLSRMVSADSCLDFEELLSPGKMILISLAEPPGGLSSLQTLWANLLLRVAIESLLARPSPWSGHHVRVIIDEAQVVAPVLSDVAETILTTGRSKGISLVVLSQGTTLLKDASDTLLKVLLTNTPTRFIGRLGAPDAELLAKELAPGLGIDESVKEVRTRFVSTVTNLKERNFYLLQPGARSRFVSETVDLAGWHEQFEQHKEEIKEMKSRLSLPETSMPRLSLTQAVNQTAQKQATRQQQKPSPAKKRWG